MPRYIIELRPTIAKHDDLVKALAKELKSDSGGIQPLILERVVHPGPMRYVVVIWDKFKSVPADLRPEVIVTAYDKAEGKAHADTVMTAEGVTALEALALGHLPYCVATARKKNDPIGQAGYAAAVKAEATATVLGAKAKELRYARREDAEAAAKRLNTLLPGSVWAVSEQTEPPDE